MDVIKNFQISNKLMNSIHEYIFNDLKDLFIGKLNTTKDSSNINFSNYYYDIIDSPSSKIKDSNLIMIPKLSINKANKRNIFNELLEIAYNKLNNNKNNNTKSNNNVFLYKNTNSFYHEIFFFRKEKNTNNLETKIYTIFPNINFEFRQIKNLSFSNTNLNKYLISSKFKLPENDDSNNNNENNNCYDKGFFTMSQNHRLIALKDDLSEEGESDNDDPRKGQSLKEIIVGIWLNIKNEKPSPKKSDLDFLFEKYKYLIYKECFRFIKLSNQIETIYSPSPEDNMFLLVIFYKGMQCHYEVRLNSSDINEKKIYNKNNNHNDNIIENGNNKWIMCKCKYKLDEEKLKIPFDFDIKIEINHGKVLTMAEYLNKKNKNITLNMNNKNNNQIDEEKEKIIQNNNINKKESNNGQKSFKYGKININNNNDNINDNHIIKNNINNNISMDDIFNVSDYEEEENNSYVGYNYPLARPESDLTKNYNQNSNNNININNINTNNNNYNYNIIKNNQNNQNNLNNQNINIYKKQQHETSRASTNAHSNKPSLTSSKNSGKNNISISNVDNINQINEEESNINETETENSFELINQYTCNIMKNSENIKKLQNQVNKLEKNIMEIIEQLENDKKSKKNNNKKKKKKKKKYIKKKDEDDNNNTILNSKKNDISNIGDVSINVPTIVYKELSITKDDL